LISLHDHFPLPHLFATCWLLKLFLKGFLDVRDGKEPDLASWLTESAGAVSRLNLPL
jgi:hypothetical protein